MKNGLAKGLKPLLIKRLALLMGICYLVNPLHQQINSVFHNVSHALEIPDYIMSHDSNYEHESYGHTDYQIGNLNHDHEIVDFIDSVFDASDEDGGSEDSMLTEIKIDKHITTYQFQFQNNFNIAIFQNFWLSQEKLESGYLKRLKEPPQYFNNQSV